MERKDGANFYDIAKVIRSICSYMPESNFAKLFSYGHNTEIPSVFIVEGGCICDEMLESITAITDITLKWQLN